MKCTHPTDSPVQISSDVIAVKLVAVLYREGLTGIKQSPDSECFPFFCCGTQSARTVILRCNFHMRMETGTYGKVDF